MGYLCSNWHTYPITFNVWPKIAICFYNGASQISNPAPAIEIYSRTYSQVYIRAINPWSGSMILIGY
mgnify:CR=1 FL=1